MSNDTIETTVGDLVRTAPVRARVFGKLGIDFCCGGKKSLAEACRARGLDPETVLTMLQALDAAPDPTLVDADAMSVLELCTHIESAHHGYLKDELPRLDFMTRKVAAVHGDHEPRLLQIREVFESFARELVEHILDEESRVFPLIKRKGEGADVPRDVLRDAIEALEHEHEHAGAALVRLRELTENYSPPEWACNTFRALYDGLGRLEENMHQHVHKENNILFPRALV